MADNFSIRVHTDALLRDMHRVDRHVDEATRKTVREMGRLVASRARRKARVYRGPPRVWSVDGKQFPTIPGELRKGIKPSRRLRKTPDGGYALTVGPRGGHVHLYAQKIEKLDAYMTPAVAEATPEARRVGEKNWDKAVRKGR